MIKHILVVDDSREVADTKVLVIRNLGREEFSAEAVYGGQACLERIEKKPAVDLILLDMDMPMVNGADVIRAFLNMSHPPARILPMTAWGPGWVQHWGLTELAETKAFQYWVWKETYDKATDPQELLDMVRHALTDFSSISRSTP